MIRLFGRLFWNVVITRLSGPIGAQAPRLIIVDVSNYEDSNERNDIPLAR